MGKKKTNLDPDAKEYVARYAEHARRLQTWIGAYGAGLASLLVYQFRTAVADMKATVMAQMPDPKLAADEISKRLADLHGEVNSALKLIAYAILLQVILLMINKISQFQLGNRPIHSRAYRAGDRVSDWFSIDVVFDVASLVLLYHATRHSLRAIGVG